MEYDTNSNYSYIIECDLEYPESIHDLTRYYPLACELITVDPHMLSQEQQQMMQNEHITHTQMKLTPNVMDKRNYVCVIDLFLFYIRMGMKCTRIHSVIKFNTDYILRDYITDLSEQRRIAKQQKNDCLADAIKVNMNSLYGRLLLNICKRQNGTVIVGNERLHKIVNKPDFISVKPICENIAYVQRSKKTMNIHEPRQIAAYILDYSKLEMYLFYYDVLVATFGERNISLLMTDTDSFIVEIKHKNLINDIRNEHTIINKRYMEYIDHTGHGKLGYFKNECPNDWITRFVGLKSKMYSFETEKHKNKSICKGITYKTKSNFTFNLYEHVLYTRSKLNHVQSTLRSYNHNIHLQSQSKVSLSYFDDKRVFIKDSFDTLPNGHYLTKKKK